MKHVFYRLSLLVMTVIMACCLSMPASAVTGEYSAEMLYKVGLFKGTGTNPDGTPIFDLQKTTNRGQTLIMLIRILGKEDEALNGTWEIPFTDVSDALKPYIGYAYTHGISNGTSTTTYSQYKHITAAQCLTLFLRAVGHTEAEFTVATACEFAPTVGFTTVQFGNPQYELIRGDVANIAYDAYCIIYNQRNEQSGGLAS